MKSATFGTGMPDFNKLTTTILCKTISKGNAKKIFYRDQNIFETGLQSKLTSWNYYWLLAVSVYISGDHK